MRTPEKTPWNEANQRYLMARIAAVREAIERRLSSRESGASGANGEGMNGAAAFTPSAEAMAAIEEARGAMPAPAAIDLIERAFGLSPFERDVLLLCAGVELASSFAGLCARLAGDARRTRPTWGLALAALPGAHWSALSPAAPLRYFRLIEQSGAEVLTEDPIRIDERILHHLTGVATLDERLRGFVRPVPRPRLLAASHERIAEKIAARLFRGGEGVTPVAAIFGGSIPEARAVAAAACAAAGAPLFVVDAEDIPLGQAERELLARLWEREAWLSGGALLIDARECPRERARAVTGLADSIEGPVIVSLAERDRPESAPRRGFIRFDVERQSAEEQRALWSIALGPIAALEEGAVKDLSAQFSLDGARVEAIVDDVIRGDPSLSGAPLSAALWAKARVAARGRIDEIAQRIDARVTWSDIVLPEAQTQALREIAAHVRQRATVHEAWGFADRSARGLGLSALFAGTSGTGKTLAAEVLAHELRLDLYKIDLSQVVSKYIGETEKNLRRAFDAAEEGGVILLFDEADALFGKRSEVKDSHDRYANIEVSYLLQRMEAYRGLAILTTNMKSALDPAFLRRLRFVVTFPFPDTAQRAEIWRRAFPARAPVEGLDVDKLARLGVSGGNIRNIALSAAFLAAGAGEPVRMTHVMRAVRGEYAKLEKPLTSVEIGGLS